MSSCLSRYCCRAKVLASCKEQKGEIDVSYHSNLVQSMPPTLEPSLTLEARHWDGGWTGTTLASAPT